MMLNSVQERTVEEIDQYLINDLQQTDILLLIVLTDAALTIQFNPVILTAAVRYVMRRHQVGCH